MAKIFKTNNTNQNVDTDKNNTIIDKWIHINVYEVSNFIIYIYIYTKYR